MTQVALEASNLGQIIGRLMYGEMERAPGDGAKAPTRIGNGKRLAQVLALCERHGEVSADMVRKHLGVTSGNAAVMLLTMMRAGQLIRIGEPRHYRYKAPPGT